jgi:phage regulator Rha-like protein
MTKLAAQKVKEMRQYGTTITVMKITRALRHTEQFIKE